MYWLGEAEGQLTVATVLLKKKSDQEVHIFASCAQSCVPQSPVISVTHSSGFPYIDGASCAFPSLGDS